MSASASTPSTRELLRLLDERAGLAHVVAAAKAAAGDAGKFGLRPGREAQLLREPARPSRIPGRRPR